MARRVARPRFVRPAKSTKVWLGAGFAAANVPDATAVLLQTLNAAALLLRPFTVLRTRMMIVCISNQVIATESFQGVFSHQVVKEAAATAGAASVPTPLTETDADFHVYQPYAGEFTFLDSTGVNRETEQYVIDSKAMRKVGLDDDIAVIVQNRGSDGIIIGGEGRFLIQLH